MVKVRRMSIYLALAILAASGFMAQPTLASLFEHTIIIPTLLFLLIVTAHYESYKQAVEELAPGRGITGHPLYSFIAWMETEHLGVRGVWYVMGGLVVLTVLSRFH